MKANVKRTLLFAVAISGCNAEVKNNTPNNLAPTLISVTLSPEAPYASDTLMVSATSEDPEGNDVHYDIEWIIDGEIRDDYNSDFLDAATIGKGALVTARVTPTDAFGAGESMESNPVRILNSKPYDLEITLGPIPANAKQQDLVCDITTPAIDIDGDPVKTAFVWTDPDGNIARSVLPTNATSDILPANMAVEGEWTCHATPNDGEEDGPAATATVIVNPWCHSLRFDGSPNLLQSDFTLPDGPYTAEAWVRLDVMGPHPLLVFDSMNLGIYGSHGLTAEKPGASDLTAHLTPVPLKTWVHLVWSYYGGGGLQPDSWEFYINGEQGQGEARQGVVPPPLSGNTMAVGSFTAYNSYCCEDYYIGDIHSIRISTGLRYSEAFTPPISLERDSETIGLWIFDNPDPTGPTPDLSVYGNDITQSGSISSIASCPEG